MSVTDRREFIRLDVGYFDNPKVGEALDVSHAAVVLHIESMMYARRHRTDGVVPAKRVMRKVGATEDDAQTLLDAGLWEPRDGGKIYVHDYEKHQETREQIEERSAKQREKARKRWDSPRDARGNANGTPGSNASGNAEESRGEESRQTPREAPQPDFQNGGAVLSSHGMPKAEHVEFIRAMKDRGIRSWTAFVSDAHRKGTLDGLIEDWRSERDAAKVTPLSKKKGPDVGVQEWMLRG
jgi:hypothetical protein